jgi:hypothetical protein
VDRSIHGHDGRRRGSPRGSAGAPLAEGRAAMASFEVLGDVSTTIKGALGEGLKELLLNPKDPSSYPRVEINDLDSTLPSSDPPQVTLFLFEVVEDPSQKNRPAVRTIDPTARGNTGDFVIGKPPMALLLRYMVTPWAGDGLTEHRILGKVLQFFYDNAILAGDQLAGGLAKTDASLKITLAPITLEDRTRVWLAVQKPYHLSVTYEVRVVNLDSEKSAHVPPVRQRLFEPDRGEIG